MEYIILGLIIAITIFLIINYANKSKAKKDLDEIRATWGNPKKEHFHFVIIGLYAEIVKEKFHRLTDQTIEDIDFKRLFAFIDRTTSKIGQQFLFKKVTEPTNHAQDPAEKFVIIFTDNKALREQVQTELLRLRGHDAYYIATLLRNRFLIEEPKWLKFIMADVIIVVSLCLLAFKFPGLLIVLIVPFALNMFIHYGNKSNTFQFTRSIPQLNILINVSKILIEKGGILYDKSVEESISNLKSFQRKASLIKFEGDGIMAELSQLSSYLMELIKAFFLIEVIMFFKVMRELKDKQSSIITLFNYVGNLDASISIVSLRAGKLKTCQPVFTPAKKEIVVKNIYHPLIKDCVKNTLSINDKSILITGSNMSGKSTFLRTMAINSILAQTIYTCFADEYITPVLKQFSSIRIDDNLFEGKSYYFQEVNIMGSLIKEVETTHQNLFVLDEVFKGTNTLERISAAKAILSYLNQQNNVVMVATHDIELAEMLKNEYDLYHFTEIVEDGQLHFDHKIKPGQLKTRNAIKILELSGYPSSIIDEARSISQSIVSGKMVENKIP